MKPLVSVIIPTLNRRDYIQLAINSVLDQTYQNIELIVIDDGSSDGTSDVVKEKYGNKLTYIWQENQGESVARNNGLAIARGKYVNFLDSDDYWDPRKIDIEVEFLHNAKSQEYVAICSSVWVVNEEGNLIKSDPSGRSIKLSNYEIYDFFSGPKIFAPPSNLLLRSSTLRELGGFDDRIQYGEDWDLVIRLRSKGKIFFLDEPLVYYRIHPSSQQGIPKPEKIDRVIKDHIKVITQNRYLVDSRYSKEINNQISIEYVKGFAWCAVYDKLDLGFTYLELAKLINPRVSTSKLFYQQVGYWLAMGLIQEKKSSEIADNLFMNEILPKFMDNWPAQLGHSPSAKHLAAWFYHNLAFNQVQNTSQKYYLWKSIAQSPLFLFKPSTIKLLFLTVQL